MKLTTTIQPREDGTVMVHGDNGQDYEFVKNADGNVECDVDDDSVIAKMVSSGHFYPSDPADYDTAAELTKTPASQVEDDVVTDEGFGQADALPVEANTPPARFKPAKKK